MGVTTSQLLRVWSVEESQRDQWLSSAKLLSGSKRGDQRAAGRGGLGLERLGSFARMPSSRAITAPAPTFCMQAWPYVQRLNRRR